MGRRSFAWTTLVCPLLFAGPALAEGPKKQCVDANVRGQDLRREGKLSAAREAFRTCAASTCPPMVRDDCTKRLDEIERAQPTVIFEARDGSGNDLVGVRVTIDGQPFTDRLTGAPVAADPGEHTFVFEAPGQPRLEKKLVLREGEQGRLEKVTIGVPTDATPERSPPPAPSPVMPSEAPPVSGPSGSGLGAQKILAIAAGIVGVAGLGVGSAFGLTAISKKSDAQGVCPNALCPDTNGSNRWADAKSTGDVATAAFVVGGVGLAAGALLWLTAPAGAPGTRLGVGPTSLRIEGAW
jgi:hypothetical protein